MLDEQQIEQIASNLTVPDATAIRDQKAAIQNSAQATSEGRKVEIDQEIGQHQRFNQSRATRAAAGAQEMAGHVANHFKSGSKSSITEAAMSKVRIQAEQDFLSDVLRASQQRIDAARTRLRQAELATMKANIEFMEADVVLMAVQHRDAAKQLLETDPSIEQIPFGPRIVEALTLIARMRVDLTQKEKEGNSNGTN